MSACPHCRGLHAPKLGVTLDSEHRLAWRGGGFARLAPTEFLLVDALLHAWPKPAYQDWLIETIWPGQATDNALFLLLRRTRRAIAVLGLEIRPANLAYLLAAAPALTAPTPIAAAVDVAPAPPDLARAPEIVAASVNWAQRLPAARMLLQRLGAGA